MSSLQKKSMIRQRKYCSHLHTLDFLVPWINPSGGPINFRFRFLKKQTAGTSQQLRTTPFIRLCSRGYAWNKEEIIRTEK